MTDDVTPDEPEWMAHAARDSLAALADRADHRSNGSRPSSTGPSDDVDPASLIAEHVLDLAALRRLRPPTPLVAGLLDLDSLAVLYGPPGAGKSVVALDLALRVATGTRWHGHREVECGPVLYIAAEGAHGLAARVDAWKESTTTVGDPGLIEILPIGVNLLSMLDVSRLAAYVKQLEPVLVVVDTLARCTVGAEENSSRDMSTAVAGLDQIRAASHACVLAVHHSGKNLDAGLRGHTALLGAVDTVLRVTTTERILNLEQEKQKHHEPGHRQTYRLASVAKSVALAPFTGVTADDLTEKTVEVLRVLAEIEQPEGISWSEWRGAADELASRPTIARARKTLLGRGLIEKTESSTDARPRYVLTDAGRSHLSDETIDESGPPTTAQELPPTLEWSHPTHAAETAPDQA